MAHHMLRVTASATSQGAGSEPWEWEAPVTTLHSVSLRFLRWNRSHGPALRFDGPANEKDLVGADTARAPIVCVGEFAPAIEVLFDVLFDEDLGADLCRDAGRF